MESQKPYRVAIGKYTYNLNACNDSEAVEEATYIHIANGRFDKLDTRDDGKLVPTNPIVQCLAVT